MLIVPLSGGPHSGKTTTFEALKDIYPEAYFVEEAAERLIDRELKKHEEDSDYEPITPDRNYPAFQPLVLEEQLGVEREIPTDANLVFSDRSLIDHIGYCNLNGLSERVPEIERYSKLADYAFAFFCEPVGEYKQTRIRRENPEEAKATHDAISLAYDLSDVQTVHLPAVSLEKRLDIIAETLKLHRG